VRVRIQEGGAAWNCYRVLSSPKHCKWQLVSWEDVFNDKWPAPGYSSLLHSSLEKTPKIHYYLSKRYM